MYANILLSTDGSDVARKGVKHGFALAKALNCKDAINFDGGGSTTMYIQNQPENGVVNYPSDNKIFDHAGERAELQVDRGDAAAVALGLLGGEVDDAQGDRQFVHRSHIADLHVAARVRDID